ncbi:MAG: hypothetical protein BroJett024_06560 [Alphaproteobacteria bacterium]|nr:MAG: hypothetical protein BroJett024_06560 [Alphaproteobacteria bacterium]
MPWCWMVLPDRIELSTSPFITLTLSRPPRCGVCALDHPFAIDPVGSLGATRLASTPSRRAGLGSGLPSAGPDGFPEFGRCAPGRFRPGGQVYQGSALPLSYGSELDSRYPSVAPGVGRKL